MLVKLLGTHMNSQLWFFTKNGNINLGSKPSVLASFVILTSSTTDTVLRDPVKNDDLKVMGYSSANDLINDPDHPSKVRVYVRKKYSELLSHHLIQG